MRDSVPGYPGPGLGVVDSRFQPGRALRLAGISIKIKKGGEK